MLNSTKKPRVPPVPRVSCHTVAERVRCVPAPVTGAVTAGTGTVWHFPTRGLPVTNPNYLECIKGGAEECAKNLHRYPCPLFGSHAEPLTVVDIRGHIVLWHLPGLLSLQQQVSLPISKDWIKFELYLVCIVTWNPQYLGFAAGICAEKGSREVRWYTCSDAMRAFSHFYSIFIWFYFDFPIHYCFISQIFTYPFAFGRHSHSRHATCSPHVRISSRTCPEWSRGTGAPQLTICNHTIRSNSKITRTNRSIRTMGPTHAETSRTHYQHNDEASYYISEVDLQKLPYMDRFICHWFVLHSKISFNTVKIQLIHSTPCTTFFPLF